MGRVMQAAEMGKVERGACLRLLDQGVIGWVVYTEAAWPAVQPVSYLLDGQEVIFRAGGGSKLAAATRCAVVAFQVDQIDSRTDTGWSVLGVVWLMKSPTRVDWPEFADRLPILWASDRTAHIMAIPLQQLTGRYLVARE
jgi:uncharacterized protein